MEQTCKCGLLIKEHPKRPYTVNIVYCPLHSAAPELLEACKWMRQVIDADKYSILAAKTDAAIAKAEAAAPDWGRVTP